MLSTMTSSHAPNADVYTQQRQLWLSLASTWKLVVQRTEIDRERETESEGNMVLPG